MKKITVLITAFLMIFVLASCHAEITVTNDATSSAFEIETFKNDVLSTVKFEDGMEQINEDIVFSDYSIENTDGLSCVSYKIPGTFSDEFTVFTCPDNAVATVLKTISEQYVSDLAEDYSDYAPAEAEKLNNAIIRVKNNYCIVIVTSDTDTAESLINK